MQPYDLPTRVVRETKVSLTTWLWLFLRGGSEGIAYSLVIAGGCGGSEGIANSLVIAGDKRHTCKQHNNLHNKQ